MRESYWKFSSLILMTVLIVVVASWASGMQTRKKTTDKEKEKEMPTYAEQALEKGGVVVESHKQRFSMFSAGSRGTDNEKIILYDTWDVAETKDVWMMKDPHTEHPMWVRIPFDRK